MASVGGANTWLQSDFMLMTVQPSGSSPAPATNIERGARKIPPLSGWIDTVFVVAPIATFYPRGVNPAAGAAASGLTEPTKAAVLCCRLIGPAGPRGSGRQVSDPLVSSRRMFLGFLLVRRRIGPCLSYPVLMMGYMSSMVLLAEAASAIDVVNSGLDGLFAGGIAPVDGPDAIVWLREIEVLRRRVDASATALVGAIEVAQLHTDDGHSSARVMAQHHAKLSGSEAKAREKTSRACRNLPDLESAWQHGEIGTDQMHLLGRVHANQRVAPAMEARQDEFLSNANNLSARQFEAATRQWERLIDEDGPEPANERTHNNRNAHLGQNPWDGSWELTGFFASLQGAEMREVFDHFIDAEFQADWAEAKARLGDAVTSADLQRTTPQRRADALHRIFHNAATAPGGAVPPGWVHNIHWSASAYQEMLDAIDTDRPPKFDPDDFMCQTPNGHNIDACEAATNSLFAHIRRMIIDTNGVVIDLGRARRFTGSARTAALAGHTCCIWPGCTVPATACDIDHLHEHGKGGATNPQNGAPLCGRHNRWKQKGFTIRRLPDGTWHTTRPDGSQLE